MPASFLLIHGAWHGGWCWDRVAARLRDLGHRVWTPTLRGLCERAGELDHSVDLSEHVDEIERLVEAQSLRALILCGHSYGGMIVSELACRIPDRISRLVYLDALLPDPGQSAVDLMSEEARMQFYDLVGGSGDGWLIPPRSAAALGVTDPDDARWVDRMCTPMPLKCFEERVKMHGGLPDLPKSFLLARDNCPSVFEQTYNGLEGKPGWSRSVLATGHDAMITAPDAVADTLLSLV